MKIALLYLRIVKKSDPNYPVRKNYDESTQRFIHTYKIHKPAPVHDLIVANCGGYAPDALFKGLADDEFTCIASGYDTGTYQEMNHNLMGYDLVVAMNTHVHFIRDGWLEPLVAAAQANGPGVYAPSASYESNAHLRTPCIAYHPGVLAEYPLHCRTRGDCCLFEAGPENFSLWAWRRGFPSLLVTGDGNSWPIDQWRVPPNIFRRGDQSNCLVWDRHHEVYAQASDAEKRQLEQNADTRQPVTARPKAPTSAEVAAAIAKRWKQFPMGQRTG